MAVILRCRETHEQRDSLLRQAQLHAGLCQTGYWARVIQDVDHARPFCLEVLPEPPREPQSEAAPVPLMSLLVFHKIPWDRRRQTTDYLALLASRWAGWLEWGDGPVMHAGQKDDFCTGLAELLVWIERYAKKNKLTRVIMRGFPHTSPWVRDEDIRALFVANGYVASLWGTYLVDLATDEEKLWHQLEPAARKGVNKARRASVRTVRIGTIEDFRERFYSPYCSSERHASRKVPPFRVFEAMWREDLDGYCRYYVVELPDGEVIATLGLHMFNGVATEILSSLSPRAFEEKIPAQDLLHWELLLEARNAGCHTFDLAGVNPNPGNDKEIGIRRFKEKWGGRYVEYDRYERVFWVGRIIDSFRAGLKRWRAVADRAR